MNPEKHRCPKCGESRGFITDSRPGKQPNVERRRNYRCASCDARWAKHEVVVGLGGGDIMTDGRKTAILFVRDIERAARERFGDEFGNLLVGRRGGK